MAHVVYGHRDGCSSKSEFHHHYIQRNASELVKTLQNVDGVVTKIFQVGLVKKNYFDLMKRVYETQSLSSGYFKFIRKESLPPKIYKELQQIKEKIENKIYTVQCLAVEFHPQKDEIKAMRQDLVQLQEEVNKATETSHESNSSLDDLKTKFDVLKQQVTQKSMFKNDSEISSSVDSLEKKLYSISDIGR